MGVDRLAFFLLVALAAVGGCMRDLRRGPAFFWGVPILLTVSVLVVIGTMRYRAPAGAFAVVLPAAGLAELLREVAGARDRRGSSAS